ncbi:unnamed protein product [Meloidogyne enterolobii]|uniref:Uncharacterized protein n=1 Tax=Meloidogyne enterolobii TaxID=390850 RepID=A0ACB0YMQ0_MELEN
MTKEFRKPWIIALTCGLWIADSPQNICGQTRADVLDSEVLVKRCQIRKLVGIRCRKPWIIALTFRLWIADSPQNNCGHKLKFADFWFVRDLDVV